MSKSSCCLCTQEGCNGIVCGEGWGPRSAVVVSDELDMQQVSRRPRHRRPPPARRQPQWRRLRPRVSARRSRPLARDGSRLALERFSTVRGHPILLGALGARADPGAPVWSTILARDQGVKQLDLRPSQPGFLSPAGSPWPRPIAALKGSAQRHERDGSGTADWYGVSKGPHRGRVEVTSVFGLQRVMHPPAGSPPRQLRSPRSAAVASGAIREFRACRPRYVRRSASR